MTRSIASIACFSLLLGTACIKGEDDSPDLPPAESLSVDLSVLNSAPVGAKNAPTGQTAAPEDYLNFANAWARVKVVQFFAGLVIVVPAAAIAAALQQSPMKDGDRWVWQVTVGDTTADLEVAASLVSGFDVDLYVTNPQLTRYLWVEGNFGDGSGTGEWVLHDPEIEGDDDRALSITWTYVSSTDRSLSYEILSPRPNANDEVFQGDTFSFSVDGTNATLEYEDADEPGTVAVISWDTGTGAGLLQVPGFNAGAAACWDELFENTGC